jgi:hypothetical protein
MLPQIGDFEANNVGATLAIPEHQAIDWTPIIEASSGQKKFPFEVVAGLTM